ncbi:MAG TPA: glycosyltransferase family 4 protein [Methanothrix sp.]|nr:glycosyltransferase family 4 protein [Methanothrix sp.]HOK57803.1 glycosyltransferase family 4 protein [Methanothrix sp.]HOL43203.1 glycosyltransferase family 4 protein [Methanothrix sp.]HPO88303.1 glycosyltransferase family 4 protein [Methanothrix sp.]
MRIAYVYDAVYPWIKGGVERRVYELSQRLARRGHEVHCYGSRWWRGEREIRLGGVWHHGVCPPHPLYIKDKRSVKQALLFSLGLLRYLEGGYDVIDCQEFPYLSCFSARVRSGGASFFITWHEIWGDYWIEYMGRSGYLGMAVERAAAMLTGNNIAVSEMTGRELMNFGVRSTVVPNGIDFRHIQSIRPADSEHDLVFAGRLVSHKNLHMLLEAIALLSDVNLLIIGEGPEAPRLHALARSLGLNDRVRFSGFLKYEDTIALIKSSRAFVLPSTREGFGMVALEAMACGVPVITVRHRMNAACDLLTPETGVIAEPSPYSLADAIRVALDLSKAAGSRCREIARRYDWDVICGEIERVYAERV